MPTITRARNPTPARVGPDGPHYSAEWTVEASSETHALDILRDQLSVYRGAVYCDENGNIPDVTVRCQSLTVRGAPPAPRNGTGLYRVTAEYSRSNYVYRRVAEPSGGVIYRIEGSLVSEPVDTDIDGRPIMNDAHEPVDPPLQMLVVHKVLVREWISFANTWEEVYTRLAPFEGCVNSQPYRGAPRGCLLCEPVVVEDAGYADMAGGHGLEISPPTGFLVRMRFQYRPPKRVLVTDQSYIEVEGWDEAFWQRARRKFVGGQDPEAMYQPFRQGGSDGPVVTEPVPINTDLDPWRPGQARAVKVVRLYPRIDFNSIPSN